MLTTDVEVAVEYEIADPRADAIIQSSRAIGYDLPTAIADIMDNSIAAGASNIWLTFFWDGEHSWIAIRDDGNGMTEDTLVNAMRLGSLSPLEQRDERDLGRFGLGLKTASFSHCKRLIVRTRMENASICTRCWDLDYVTRSREWRLLREVGPETGARLAEFDDQSHGTIVLWEVIDRLVAGNQTESRKQQDRFLERAEQVIEHISMVFHKFLEPPNRRLTCWVNGQKITPWNPFLQREDATQWLPEEHLHIGNATVDVAPFILPHHSRIKSDVFQRAASSRGWNDMQGFYVYRNGRMLVAGDWLGLGFQKEEHCKLARIEVNITSSMDMEWQIDVKKSRARPPAVIREDLRRIARLTRAKAVEVYRSRGKVLVRSRDDEVVFLWQALRRHGKNRFVLNRMHPAVLMVKQCCDSRGSDCFEGMLRLIEETLPISCADETESGTTYQPTTGFGGSAAQLLDISRVFYQSLRAAGKTPEQAIQVMATMAPFNQFPEILCALYDEEGVE